MNEGPTFPAFEIIGKERCLELHKSPDTFKMTTRLAVFHEFYKDVKFYDSEGYCWSVESVESDMKATFFNKLLAHTFYNPSVSFIPHWRKEGKYKLDELKSLYVNAVQQDDDILTQFVDGEQLIQRVNAVKSIKDLIAVAEWMQTDWDCLNLKL